MVSVKMILIVLHLTTLIEHTFEIQSLELLHWTDTTFQYVDFFTQLASNTISHLVFLITWIPTKNQFCINLQMSKLK